MAAMPEAIAPNRAALSVTGPSHPAAPEVLNSDALELLGELHARFEPVRRELLAARRERQARFDQGELPDFLPETRAIREGDWRVAEIPERLRDRRVEITGPVERKMIINALNSGAKVFMADFEDSLAPTWASVLEGQVNLRDAVSGSIAFDAPTDATTRSARIPRCSWCARAAGTCGEARARGRRADFRRVVRFRAVRARQRARPGARALGPFWYLPKLQSHREAKLWDEVMAYTEVRLGLPIGTMKVTVLIETLPAAFEMHEILHALKGRIVGLNCGRWDYIFSYLKTFRSRSDRTLPERGQITMSQGFLRAYSELLIQTCHQRGALALGGMAAQIPIAGDPAANLAALAKVRADKQREVHAGHDGTWVAHPGLVPIALGEFDAGMRGPNQLEVLRQDVAVGRDQLIAPAPGSISRAGFLNNIDVCVRYLAAWLDGLGCVPIHHLMEDAATAEIARVQLWQWLHVGNQALDDGTRIDFALFDRAVATISERLPRHGLPGQERLAQAAWMLAEMTHAREMAEFLTLPAYELLP
jgi:malate synthase